MANTIKLKIQVDDDGNLKLIGKNAEKAAAGLEKTGKAARTADRNLKGAAQASANSSKNFAKLTQGTGGLVGAYATLAASLFAVSAAYNFLKRAGELTSLQQGQEAYASATGKALRTLTNDIIDATDAQITFRDAAQAAAIGTAAGLGADQLERLGTAAKDASIVLGRDVTDSFNRLVRGVTKAEPELLDELGIILRLEDATRDYALQIGKSAKDLTAFERSQAVANDVLTQAEEKYSRILAVTGGGQVNQFAQLGKAFDDISNSIAKTAALIAGPFAKVLTDIPALGLAAFGLLLKGPLLALGVNFDRITEAAKDSAAASKKNFEELSKKAKIASGNVEAIKDNFKNLGATINKVDSGTSSKILDKLQDGGVDGLSGSDKASLKRSLKAAKNNVNEFGVVTKGIFKGVKLTMVKEFEEGFKLVDLAENKKLAKSQVWGAKMKAIYAGAAAGAQNIGAKLATGLTTALSWLGWIGLAYTAFQVLNQQFGFFNNELSESDMLIEKNRDRLKDLNQELKAFTATTLILSEGNLTQGFKSIGGAISSIGGEGLSQTLDDYREVFEVQKRVEELQKKRSDVKIFGRGAELGEIDSQIRSAKKLSEEGENARKFIDDKLLSSIDSLESKFGLTSKSTNRLREALRNFAQKGTAEAKKEVLDAAKGVEAFAGNLEAADRASKAASDSFKTFVNSFAPISQGQQAIDNLETSIKAIDNQLEEIDKKPTLVDSLYLDNVAGPLKGQTILQISPEEERLRNKRREQVAQLKLVDKLEAARLKRQKELLQIQNGLIRSEIGRTNAAIGYDKLQDSFILNSAKIADKEAEIADIRTIDKEQSKGLIKAQKARIALLLEEITGLERQGDVIAERLDLEFELLSSREKLQNIALNNTIINAEQNLLNIASQRLQLEKELLKAKEDAANIRTERAILDYDKQNPFAFLDREAKIAQLRFKEEKALIAERIKTIVRERDLKLQQINLEYKLLNAKLQQSELELEIFRVQNAALLDEGQQRRIDEVLNISQSIRGSLAGLQADAERSVSETAANSISKALLNLDKLEFAKDNLTEMGQITDTLAQSFGNGMVSAFDSVIQGTMSVRDAFKQMAVSVLQALSQVIAKLIVIKLLELALSSFSFGGGGGGTAPQLGGGTRNAFGDVVATPTTPIFTRYGGIPEKTPGYSEGGIARGRLAGYPAILHGTEAVVPLPNGKEIPVQMMNGGGQSNNVVVNVNVDSDGNAQQDTQANQQQGANLGNAIAAAVQKELLNQKRSGGILNPYGVA